MKHKTKIKTLSIIQRGSLRGSIFSLRANYVLKVKCKGRAIPFYFNVKDDELVTYDNVKVVEVEYG